MATRQNWLMELPNLAPGSTLHIYPRDGLEPAEAEAAMKAMGYNMGHYRIPGTHGNALLIRRFDNVKGLRPQADQPENVPGS